MQLKLISKAEGKNNIIVNDVHNFSIDEEIRSRRKTYSKLSTSAKMVLAAEQLNIGSPTLSIIKKSASVKNSKLLREIYSAQNNKTLPGKLVRKEGDSPVYDKEVNYLYDYAGKTWDFYHSLFCRNSIDNAGMKLILTVHYGKDFQNALWDGRQMIYGDGDGKLFGSFALDVDITGHELTHGVIQFECNLDYRDQSGALNESLADVFGIMIKQRVLNEDVKKSNWLIGENTLIGKKFALRSLKRPGEAYVNHPDLGTDPQPAHMNDYTVDPDDNGGVHLNSGIPNHAFYLASYDVGGYSWEKVGRVWYNAMCNIKLVPINATFADFKRATIAESNDLFGAGSRITKAIVKAWKDVGV